MKNTQRRNRARRRGRPKGSRNVLVKPGLSRFENLALAAHGNSFASEGWLYGEILWDAAHPSSLEPRWIYVANGDWVRTAHPEQYAAGSTALELGEEAVRRAKAGDGQFFKDVGETLERLNSGRFADDKYHHELLWFATCVTGPDVPLSVADVQAHLKKEGFADKSLGAIRRDLRLLGIPYTRGKAGRKPAPRPAQKRKRGVSMRGTPQMVDEGWKRFFASRPGALEKLRKSEHIR